MKEMTQLEKYYNKFNEEKRLGTRHGRVEFITSMKYIHKYLEGMENPKILDIGAGTGRYSVALAEEGYDVTAVELVQHNVGRIKQKSDKVKAYKGNALNLKRFENESFDLVLLFGPMYHLKKEEEQLMALKEAKRVLKKEGVMLVAYVMNEYSVITYAFKEKQVLNCLQDGKLTADYHTVPVEEDLYRMVRLEDMDKMNKEAGLERIQVIAADGAANYIRPILNSLSEEEFEKFVEYHLCTCERMDLMGATAHTVDILKKA